ncbi:MAG: hypothetical protein JNM72_11610 [Deltaproteobacteria bacterium]|nr:hypothetical protein [Deltaproteobacteria bacterium]
MWGWLGWDVGAWHCQSGASRDALVLLAADLGQAPQLVGQPWRGNLRATLNGPRGPGLLSALLRLVGAPALPLRRLTIGVDTPLGWPDSFRALLDGALPDHVPATKAENPLIMRETEQVLCAAGLRPLSPVQDLLGSQSTKGLVALGALGMAPRTPGWWTGALAGVELAAFEAYPTPCRRSAQVEAVVGPLRPALGEQPHDDVLDALLCAGLAWLCDQAPEAVAQPPAGVSASEGWIYVPVDALPGPEAAPRR